MAANLWEHSSTNLLFSPSATSPASAMPSMLTKPRG